MTRWTRRDDTQLQQWASDQQVEAAARQLISRLLGIDPDQIEVVTVRPCTHPWCRVRRWLRRHRTHLATAATWLLVLALGALYGALLTIWLNS